VHYINYLLFLNDLN